jgi:hypothetical protein
MPLAVRATASAGRAPLAAPLPRPRAALHRRPCSRALEPRSTGGGTPAEGTERERRRREEGEAWEREEMDGRGGWPLLARGVDAVEAGGGG